jgi:hypothetical protein
MKINVSGSIILTMVYRDDSIGKMDNVCTVDWFKN